MGGQTKLGNWIVSFFLSLCIFLYRFDDLVTNSWCPYFTGFRSYLRSGSCWYPFDTYVSASSVGLTELGVFFCCLRKDSNNSELNRTNRDLISIYFVHAVLERKNRHSAGIHRHIFSLKSNDFDLKLHLIKMYHSHRPIGQSILINFKNPFSYLECLTTNHISCKSIVQYQCLVTVQMSDGYRIAVKFYQPLKTCPRTRWVKCLSHNHSSRVWP